MKTIFLFIVLCYAGLSALTSSSDSSVAGTGSANNGLFLSGLTKAQNSSCDAKIANIAGSHHDMVNSSINILDYELTTNQGIYDNINKLKNESFVTSFTTNFKICDTNIAYTIIKHLFSDVLNNGVSEFVTKINLVDENKIEPIPTNLSNNADSLIQTFFNGLKILWQLIWVGGVVYVSYHGVTYLVKKGVGDEYLSDETSKNQQSNTFTNSSRILIAIAATAPVFAGYSFLHIALLLIVVLAIAVSNVFYMIFAFSIYDGVNKISESNYNVPVIDYPVTDTSKERVSNFLQPLLNNRVCDSIIDNFWKLSKSSNKGEWNTLKDSCGYTEHNSISSEFKVYVNNNSYTKSIIPNLKRKKFIIDFINKTNKKLTSNKIQTSDINTYTDLFKEAIIKNKSFHSAITRGFDDLVGKKATFSCAKNFYDKINTKNFYDNLLIFGKTAERNAAAFKELFKGLIKNPETLLCNIPEPKIAELSRSEPGRFETYIKEMATPEDKKSMIQFAIASRHIHEIARAFIGAYKHFNPIPSSALSNTPSVVRLNAVINRGFLSAHDLVFRTNTFRDNHKEEDLKIQLLDANIAYKNLYKGLFNKFPDSKSDSVNSITYPNYFLKDATSDIDDVNKELQEFTGFEPFFIKSKQRNPMGKGYSTSKPSPSSTTSSNETESQYHYFKDSPILTSFFDCNPTATLGFGGARVSFDRYPVPFVLSHCAKDSLTTYINVAETVTLIKSLFATIDVIMNRIALEKKKADKAIAKVGKTELPIPGVVGSLVKKFSSKLDKLTGLAAKTDLFENSPGGKNIMYILGFGNPHQKISTLSKFLLNIVKLIWDFIKMIFFMFIFFIVVTAMFLLLAPFAIYLYSLITAFLSWLANTFVYFITWPIQFIRSASDTHTDEEGLHKAALNQLFMPTMIVFSLSLSLIIMYAGLFIFSELYSELLQILSTNFNINQIKSYDGIIAFATMSVVDLITNWSFAESMASILFTALIPVLLLVTIVSKSITMSDSLLSKLASVAGLRYRPELNLNPITLAAITQQIQHDNARKVSEYVGRITSTIRNYGHSYNHMRKTFVEHELKSLSEEEVNNVLANGYSDEDKAADTKSIEELNKDIKSKEELRDGLKDDDTKSIEELNKDIKSKEELRDGLEDTKKEKTKIDNITDELTRQKLYSILIDNLDISPLSKQYIELGQDDEGEWTFEAISKDKIKELHTKYSIEDKKTKENTYLVANYWLEQAPEEVSKVSHVLDSQDAKFKLKVLGELQDWKSDIGNKGLMHEIDQRLAKNAIDILDA